MASTVASIETFLEAFIDLTALFVGQYDRGEFCSGLVFGKDGAKMLMDVAMRFAVDSENDPIDDLRKESGATRANLPGGVRAPPNRDQTEEKRQEFLNSATENLLNKAKAHKSHEEAAAESYPESAPTEKRGKKPTSLN